MSFKKQKQVENITLYKFGRLELICHLQPPMNQIHPKVLSRILRPHPELCLKKKNMQFTKYFFKERCILAYNVTYQIEEITVF